MNPCFDQGGVLGTPAHRLGFRPRCGTRGGPKMLTPYPGPHRRSSAARSPCSACASRSLWKIVFHLVVLTVPRPAELARCLSPFQERFEKLIETLETRASGPIFPSRAVLPQKKLEILRELTPPQGLSAVRGARSRLAERPASWPVAHGMLKVPPPLKQEESISVPQRKRLPCHPRPASLAVGAPLSNSMRSGSEELGRAPIWYWGLPIPGWIRRGGDHVRWAGRRSVGRRDRLARCIRSGESRMGLMRCISCGRCGLFGPPRPGRFARPP